MAENLGDGAGAKAPGGNGQARAEFVKRWRDAAYGCYSSGHKFCREICPVTQVTRNENHSPTAFHANIVAMEQGLLDVGDVAEDYVHCTQCGACELRCPNTLFTGDFYRHRTRTVAPEAGTERLRRAIRKPITDEQLYTACDLVRRHGIPNLKCYFMIGQPTETSEDVAAIPDLAGRMLERLRVLDPTGKPFGKLTLSISSFVPKPWTPFQWAPFDGAESLSAKLETIKRGVRTFSNVRVLHENPREAALQALLARGDRRVGDFLELAARLEGDWRRALREWDGDAGFYTTRERPVGERMPWDHFEVGVKKAGLVREWERALAAEPALAGTA